MSKHLITSLLVIGTFLISSCSTTDIYLARHAEKVDESRDPSLTAAGMLRARDLKDALIRKGITDIYCSDYLRTRQTGQPLAEAIGRDMILYRPDTVLQLVPILRSLRGQRVLVVGHSNTTPALIKALTGEEEVIDHGDYDNLYLVRIRNGWFGTRTNLQRLTFGVPTPVPGSSKTMQLR